MHTQIDLKTTVRMNDKIKRIRPDLSTRTRSVQPRKMKSDSIVLGSTLSQRRSVQFVRTIVAEVVVLSLFQLSPSLDVLISP